MRTKTKPAVDKVEASFQRLEQLKSGSRSLHFQAAKECSFLLKDKLYLSKRRENNNRLDELLDEVLPGLTKTTLERMYDTHPRKSDWDSLGFQAIRKAAFDSQAEEPRGKSTGMPTKIKPGKTSLTGKGQIDTTGRLNEGGGVGGLKVSELQEMRDQIASLSQENAELRQSRDEAYRRIGELEMQLKKIKG